MGDYMNDKEFNLIINDIINNDTVLSMKKYRQHFDTDCFSHCYNVSYYCYKITKKLGLDYKSSARASMLHDLFLYDWHTKKRSKGEKMHAFSHGEIALFNASKLFDLNNKEKDMILNHMWPVTLRIPRSLEGIILTIIDKYVAIREIFGYLFKVLSKNQSVKYASVVLHLVIMHLK